MVDESPLQKLTQKTLGGLRVQAVDQTVAHRNMLIYGDPGVGKTVLSGSASVVEDMAPVIIVDVEGGALPLATLYPKCETVPVNTVDQMQKVYDELLLSNEHGFKTVVLDSLTEIRYMSMDFIMEEAVKLNPRQDRDVPSQREWGKNIEQTRRLVRGFRDLPMHSIFTALAKQWTDAQGMTFTAPSVPGKLTGELAGFFDEVFYLYIKRVGNANERYILTEKTHKEIAKDRSTKLPTTLKAPTMQLLNDYFTGKVIKNDAES